MIRSKRIKRCFETLTDKIPQRPYLWNCYSYFLHFDFAFYAIKKGIRNLDSEKTTVFMIDEPEMDTEDYRKKMLLLRSEVTLKECHSVMKIGWEIDV
jgi:hypothetical protein